MPTIEALWDYFLAAGKFSIKLCLVIIPIVALWEVLKGLPLFRRHGGKMAEYAARIHFSPRAVVPLVAGIFLGLLYGAGVIIHEAREKALTQREILVLSLFLAACHAVVEDTLLFVVIGGSWWWILTPRIFIALVVTVFMGRIWRWREGSPEPGRQNGL